MRSWRTWSCSKQSSVCQASTPPATCQWTPGKAPETFAPCGPALVLWDELGDLQDKRISCRVNGKTLQDANTSQMILPDR